MTPEQSKYFDEMEELFATQGWKNLIEDVSLRQSQERDNLFAARRTREDHLISYGREEVYNYLKTMESLLDEVKRRIQEAVDE